MRITFALLAVAGCAVTPSRHSQYDTMLGELRRDEQSRTSREAKVVVAISARTLEREALIGAVLAVNRDVESMRQAWRASVVAVPTAMALDDPMASYAIAPLSIGSNAPFGQRLELSQKLPFPGTRRFAAFGG